MSDADTRITNDANVVVNGFAKMFAELMFSTTAGVFYTANIWRVFGFRFACVPYAYLVSAYLCVNVLAKSVLDNFRKAGRLRGESWGLYTFAAASWRPHRCALASRGSGSAAWQWPSSTCSSGPQPCSS